MQTITEKRLKKAKLMREWRTHNRDKNLVYRRGYHQKNKRRIAELKHVAWLNKKDRVNAERRLRHAADPEKARAADRVRWSLDREKIKAKNRKSYHKNIEKRRAAAAKYRHEHPEIIKAWRKLNLDHLIEYNRAKRFPCAPYQYAREDECCLCSMTNQESLSLYERRLDVHHIDGNLENNARSNLLTVCRKCHKQVEKISIPVAE